MSAIGPVLTGLSTYNHQQILAIDAGLLSASTVASWKDHPLTLSPAELQVVDFDFSYVIQVINGRTKSPSELAGLNFDGLSPVAKRIDAQYHRALETYKRILDHATEEDMRKALDAKKQIGKGRFAAAGASAITLAGTGAGVGSIVGPFGTAVGATLGGVSGFIVGFFLGKKGETLYIIQQSSANRVKCLHDIDVLEKRRIEDVKAALKLRIDALAQNILEDKKKNLVNLNEQRERDQLQKICLHVKVSCLNESRLCFLHYLVYQEAKRDGVKIDERDKDWGRHHLFDDLTRLEKAFLQH